MAAESRMDRHLWAQRVVGFFFMVLMGASIYGAARSPVAAALDRGERVVAVLFGLDASDASRHTDTLMLASFDPLAGKLNLLSIPRDTRIHLPGFLFKRVNEIYGYHLRKTDDIQASSFEFKRALEYLLSVSTGTFSIPYFLQIDFSGFSKLVDILGGVWIDIKYPMHYDDYAGGYHFHKEPGRALLKGKEALLYVRFRGATGDKGRIFRQQEFLRLMAKKMAHPVNVLKFPRLVSAAASSVHTNLGFWDMVYWAAAARRVRSGDISFYILPGHPRGPFWIYDKSTGGAFTGHVLYGHALEQNQAQSILPHASRITVNVWNASGRSQLAYQITRYLRRCGYDVVGWGTYPTEQIPTRVIDRRGKILQAHEVANQLGIDNIHSEPNPKVLVDVEVVIGRNFHPAFKFED